MIALSEFSNDMKGGVSRNSPKGEGQNVDRQKKKKKAFTSKPPLLINGSKFKFKQNFALNTCKGWWPLRGGGGVQEPPPPPHPPSVCHWLWKQTNIMISCIKGEKTFKLSHLQVVTRVHIFTVWFTVQRSSLFICTSVLEPHYTYTRKSKSHQQSPSMVNDALLPFTTLHLYFFLPPPLPGPPLPLLRYATGYESKLKL